MLYTTVNITHGKSGQSYIDLAPCICEKCGDQNGLLDIYPINITRDNSDTSEHLVGNPVDDYATIIARDGNYHKIKQIPLGCECTRQR
jgi:hypothetical protein